MRRTDHRQEGEAVGLLPTPRERPSPGRIAMTVEGRPIGRDDAWTLLAVAYLGGEGHGTDAEEVATLARNALRSAPRDGARLAASLGRLVDAGLVVESAGRLRAAAPVVAFLRARPCRRGIWHDHRDLLAMLGPA